MIFKIRRSIFARPARAFRLRTTFGTMVQFSRYVHCRGNSGGLVVLVVAFCSAHVDLSQCICGRSHQYSPSSLVIGFDLVIH